MVSTAVQGEWFFPPRDGAEHLAQRKEALEEDVRAVVIYYSLGLPFPSNFVTLLTID